MSRNVNLVFVVVSLFLVFAVFFSYDNVANSDSNVISGFVVHPLYTGYALPYSYSSSSVNTFLQFSSTTNNVSRSFDTTDSIVYSRAFVSYDGQQWTPFILTTTNTVSGDWIYTKGTASVAFTPSQLRMSLNRNVTNNTYVVIYSCSRVNNAWDCHNGWQIIKFDAKINIQTTTPPVSSTGKIYYLSPSGKDNNLGTFDSPWFTLEKAWENIQPGDTIYLRNGTYRYGAQRLLDKSGTSAKLIRVWAYQNEIPVITRNDATFIRGWPNSLIYFRGNYVHFKGIEIMGNTQLDSEMWPGMRVENSNYNIFELLNIHHNGVGMTIVNQGYTAHSTGNLVLNCDFHHNQDPYTNYDNADGLLFMSITHPEDVNTIKGCRSWWNTDDGYDFDSNEGMLYVADTWAWYNGYIPDTFETTDGGDGNGFKLGLAASDALDQRSVIKRQVSNCLAFKNMAWGFNENGAKQNMELYNCETYNNGISGTWSGGFHLNVANTAYYLKNNIAYDDIPYATDFDVLTNVKNNSWNYASVIVNDADFLSVDMTGVDGKRQSDGSLPKLNFLRLSSNSDLINKGVNVGLNYTGKYPDLGAYEYP